MRSCLSVIAAALDNVESMGNDAGLDEGLPVGVEVETPGIAGAVREHLENVLARMVAPDTGVEGNAVLVRRARLADARMGEDAMTTVQPAVRTPTESVQGFMRVFVVPAVQQDLRLARRFVRAWFDRNEHQIRGRPNPHAAEANFQPADQIQSFHENGAFVELAIAVAVLENEDAIFRVLFRSANGITIRLSYPEPTAVVQAESDRLPHVRFASE